MIQINIHREFKRSEIASAANIPVARLQSWISRGHFTPVVEMPGRGRARTFKFPAAMHAMVMSFLVDLGLAPRRANMLGQITSTWFDVFHSQTFDPREESLVLTHWVGLRARGEPETYEASDYDALDFETAGKLGTVKSGFLPKDSSDRGRTQWAKRRPDGSLDLLDNRPLPRDRPVLIFDLLPALAPALERLYGRLEGDEEGSDD